MKEVIVRFAPSPTGALHIGGVRTAIYNWLYARKHKGKFYLRIEDTDKERSTKESLNQILESMKWLGMDWDGEAVHQSKRLDLYMQAVEKLLADDNAYYCYCTPDELDEMRKSAMKKKMPPLYDGRCRELSSPVPGRKPTVRFKSPRGGQVVVDDIVRGQITFEHKVLDDMIIMRSSGMPTYNLCVVVDDALMNISHIFRGDDHLNNTPKQILLYNALGYSLPIFGHLPMILGNDKARLSKRHGANSVLEYKEMGYLPEAMINYLVRLGWSYGDQEIFDVPDELIEKFTTDNLSKSAAVFNPEKMLWVNAQHIHRMDTKKLVDLLLPRMRKEGLIKEADDSETTERLVKVFTPLKERARTLVELYESSRYFFTEDYAVDEKAVAKFLKPGIISPLECICAGLEELENFDCQAIERVFLKVAGDMDMKLGKVAQPVRVAVTGRTVSPGIYEVLELLGKPLAIKRLKEAIGKI